MAMVQRANRLLTIPEDAVEKYLAEGYNLVDDQGTILQRGITKNAAGLQEELDRARKKIKKLEAENSKLKAAAKGPGKEPDEVPEPSNRVEK